MRDVKELQQLYWRAQSAYNCRRGNVRLIMITISHFHYNKPTKVCHIAAPTVLRSHAIYMPYKPSRPPIILGVTVMLFPKSSRYTAVISVPANWLTQSILYTFYYQNNGFSANPPHIHRERYSPFHTWIQKNIFMPLFTTLRKYRKWLVHKI